ncbi:TIM-barrel domain-containing protein [Paenibacillus herberti]|uniref:Glycoside hydrolase family 31 N-terminal domain-containing protein n=1 Tax=Paenibacillus herberti TaxID=1619309 RepID=A0A229NY98_9BACL|nr:TIM-barrel domain-containing protein [Paenibacillus herberti]OXM14807.1 hypothetical protein CGZ75_18215 [Paenibacillus herberti]
MESKGNEVPAVSGNGGIAALVAGHEGMKEMVFLSRLHMQRGEPQLALSLLRRLMEQVEGDSGTSLTDAALALWAWGEYVKSSDRDFDVASGQTFAADVVGRIEQQWQQPQPHWLQGGSRQQERGSRQQGSSGIYLSHLALYYAAIQSAPPHSAEETGIKLLKSIRELVFERFIKDGRVVSELGDTAIHGDIIAAAIPFGMLGIEDRILIEALYKLEETLVGKGVRLKPSDTWLGGCERPDLTCLLAWYYANKGDLARAKELLGHVEGLREEQGRLYEVDLATAREPLMRDYWLAQNGEQSPASSWSEILLELALGALAGGGATGGAGGQEGIMLVHTPTGYDDPYVTMPCERFPRHPEEGEVVLVRVLAQPFQASQSVTVLAEVNGIAAAEPVPAVMRTAPDGEKVWEARLGPYLSRDEVSYSFALQSGERSAATPAYRFNVRSWTALERVHAFYAAADGGFAALLFAPPVIGEQGDAGGAAQPALIFRADASGAVKMTFAAAGANVIGEPLQSAALQLGAGRLEVSAPGGKLALGLRSADSTVLAESFSANGKAAIEILTDRSGTVHKLRLNLRAQPAHRWFGMGERFSHYDYSGQEVDQYVYNQYRDQGLKTYMPVPFAVSSGGYSIFLDSPLYSTFRFHTRLSGLVEMEADLSPESQQLTACFLVGEPLEMVRGFASLAGLPVLPPKWSFGPWMSSNNWDSQAEVMKQAELTAAYEIPSTVLVIEQWSDEATFYIFNDAQYEVKDGSEALSYDDFNFPEWGRWPDPKGMVADLHAQGLKVLLWQIPIHKCMYGVAHGQRDQDERTLLEKGYNVANADGTPFTLPYNWFKDSHIIDFTNPEAREWWFDKRKYLANEIGVDGFKTDGGEFVFGHDLKFHDGSTGREMRNLYPNLYAGSYYDFVQEYSPQGGITFSRAGYTGAQKYPMHWAGDERSTFGAFRSSIIAGLSSGMSGIPFWGWDLGGFHGDIPTAELFVRSAQMAAFCPVMQYHAETKGEFNQDRTPWNIAERTGEPRVIQWYKKFADLRMNLLPYIYDQAIRASRTGQPMMRAMHMQFPADPNCTELISQYMFGESLLVAPVTEEGHTVKEVYLPEGSWLSLFGGDEVQGPKLLKVRADLDEIPVYIRQNSMFALDLADDYALTGHVGSKVDGYKHLCFRLYVTTELQDTFEDDLGNVVTVSASRVGTRLELSWQGNLQQDVTFLIHQQDWDSHWDADLHLNSHKAASLVSDSGQWTQVQDVTSLRPGSYAKVGKELFLAAGSRPGSLIIGR